MPDRKNMNEILWEYRSWQFKREGGAGAADPRDCTGKPLQDLGGSGGRDSLVRRVLEKNLNEALLKDLDLVGVRSCFPLLRLSMGYRGQAPVCGD